MEMASLQDLMVDTLKDLYNAEIQILQAGPDMANAVSSPQLQDALIEHLKETEQQVERLNQIFRRLGETPEGKQCKGMEGIIQENKEMIRQQADPDVHDAGLILGQQKVEHYEIAGYGTAVTFAKMLGDGEAAKLLAQTLDEEEKADMRLTDIAKASINIEAAQGGTSQEPA